MDYIVSKTKRNLIIISAVFLILKAVTIAFVFHATDPVKPDLVLSGIERFLQIVAYGYIMIVLFGYFKHYELKALQIITLSILALEIAGSVIQFSKLEGMNVSKLVPLVSVLIWVFALTFWIIFLFRVPAADFPALISIRKYAVSIFVVIILSAIIPILINQIINNRQYFELFAAIIFVIPYIFIIEFAMKLKMKK